MPLPVVMLVAAMMLGGCERAPAGDYDTARLDAADRAERARQEKAAQAMVAETQDAVRWKMMAARIDALEREVAALRDTRQMLDATLVADRLARVEAGVVDKPEPVPVAVATPAPRPAARAVRPPVAKASPAPAKRAARKPLELDLR
ncbi:hypothetical protein [Sphingomonas sp. GM_Shp_2]|uniref:hypothetical protein n=1 Tax=Sphingomonas sp. GM_Shp_2 TaxID=2937380 RepID=UPI00226A2B78|nr:hypothetical protein [Sphingomonas sp. GM_Shp_2]